jgi:hypothetical protein
MQTSTRRGALAAALAGGAASAAPASAAEPDGRRPYIVPFSERIPLRSRINGLRYVLYVRTPADFARTSAPLPLIVTLDADYQFAIAANHLEHLADRDNQAPRAVLVSIGYEGVYPDRDRYRAERTRDYTPVFWPDGGYGPRFQAASGGGLQFRQVIAEEVLPLIEARYRTDPADRTLVGHSYGGLFAAWLLQTQPDLFSRYLMVSASLWYADKLLLKREEARDTSPLSRKTRVYVAVGSWEEQPDRGGFMVSENARFAALLAARSDPLLVVKHRTFEDETHASIFPAAFSTGVRHLFRTM